jgi:hypothetical protein
MAQFFDRIFGRSVLRLSQYDISLIFMDHGLGRVIEALVCAMSRLGKLEKWKRRPSIPSASRIQKSII